ncbi:hypothetical protein KR074_002161, partial [Drosophila pseudoananassae]
LYLGIDFWTAFDLLPMHLLTKNNNLASISDPSMRELSKDQQNSLQNVIKLFPSFSKQGLGRTSLISHSIDVGEAKPIKQRHYAVSPAIEKLMYDELDRMLELGVIQESKCYKFCRKEVKYLGHVIGNGIISTDPDKIAAVRDYLTPRSVKQVRRFLGMTGWYHKFIKDYSAITSPLTDTLKTNRKFEWTSEAQEAFESIKASMCAAPVLLFTGYFSLPFSLHCDASHTGVGAVLMQVSKDGA